jgi:hypothetical protein
MKIAVTIDDDLLQQLKQQAHDEGTSLTEILNRVLRREMQNENSAIKNRPPFCQKTYPMGEPTEQVNRLPPFRVPTRLGTLSRHSPLPIPAGLVEASHNSIAHKGNTPWWDWFGVLLAV